MELIITGKNLDVAPRDRDYVEKKMTKLERHMKSLPLLLLKVVLAEEKTKAAEKRFIVEYTTSVEDNVLRAEERGQTLYEAIDRASDTFDRQIERFKGRKEARRRTHQASGSGHIEEAALAVDFGSRVARVKKHVVKPMTPDEAIDQMEMLRHDFFVFFNRETDQVSVVYRRKSGDYGLIETQVE